MDLNECSDLVIEITGAGGYNTELNISSKCLQKVNFLFRDCQSWELSVNNS